MCEKSRRIKVHIQLGALHARCEGCYKNGGNLLPSIRLMRLWRAHPRRRKCVIIVRIAQTHKYNDLQLSKLPATNEINRVPSEFEIIWNGRWWEMIHLSCYLRNSNVETSCQVWCIYIVFHILGSPSKELWALPSLLPSYSEGPRWRGAANIVYSGRYPCHNIFPRNTDAFKGQVDADLTE